ncbi:metallophosphoesterase [Alkalibacterium kapii]|uniref:Phosphoesterase n=1 Tax=Alkalibacterium kapii TaxID=426704 RepID=A0A511AXR6_9LACT|nr:metallophosphoesterase [Alkalibacterium kapii]GEK92113.1 phosphoesterase [Alkalibacterium kapii]
MAWILLALSLAVLGYIYIQNYMIDVSRYTITIPKLSENMKGKKIVHLTDLHFKAHTNKSYVETILDTTEKQEPDYIVITGDLVQAGLDGFSDTPLRHFAEECARISPTYAVTGNHDIASGSFSEYRSILTKAGVRLLIDEAVALPEGSDEGVTLMGLTERQDQTDLPQPILGPIVLTETLVSRPKILLAHRPEYFVHYMLDKTKTPDLILSGHTHAGQFRLPFLGGVFAPGQGLFPKYDYGLFNHDEDPTKRMIVSRGLGNSSFPIRINNRPEIVTITLN